MKRIIIIGLWLAGIALPGYAQEYSKRINGNQQVKVLLDRSDMKIEGYSGNEIKIVALNYEQPPERAKGLRPLYHSAQDNTGIGLSVTENEGVLLIQEASGQGGEYTIRIPENARLSIEQQNWRGQEINVQKMKSEIEVMAKNAEIHLLDVQGPVIANSTSGEIEVVFSALSQSGPSVISSVASEIDITLPANSKANFTLKSITGEIYSDLDIQLKGKSGSGNDMPRVGGGHLIEGSINNGGSNVNIQTISSNIYLRKAQ